MALFGVHGDVHAGHACILEMGDQFGLFLGIEAKIGVDAEYEEAMVMLARACEEDVWIINTSLCASIVARPHLADTQVGVGVEALDELGALVKDVGLDLVVKVSDLPISKWETGM